ncbi:MAG: DUF859 family phage minor structural protein [Hominenteromicrobium sp.]|uniref:DUF859 family phage minor structural protein n=1 Tax=Hominenteromicrobium sp. TaxID=3073581 RepID=UPI0039916735
MGKNSYKAQLNYYDSKWGWKSEGTASQGQWDGTGVRTGVLYFPGLAALKGKIINGVKLTATTGQTGYGTTTTKTVYIYNSAAQGGIKTSLNAGHRTGNALGSCKAPMWDNTKTFDVAFMAASIAAGYDTYCIYNGSSYTDYLKWTAVTLEVDWQEPATQPSLSAATVEMGKSVTINTPAVNSAYRHTLRYAFGSAAGTIATGIASSVSWTPPVSLANQIPSATAGSGTIYCDTYSGSTLLGTKSVSITLTVPGSVVPSAGTLSAALADDTSGTGLYVKGMGKAKLTLSGASGAYGSSINSYTITGGGWTATNGALTTGTLASAGNITFTATVTDSRGRKASTTRAITVIDYTKPGVAVYDVYRCDADGNRKKAGTYFAVEINASYSAITGNTLSITARYKKQSESSYGTAANVTNNGKTVIGGGNIGASTTYDVVVTVADKYNSLSIPRTLSTKSVLQSFKRSAGAAIGKVAELANWLDVAWNTRIRGNLKVDGGMSDGAWNRDATDLMLINFSGDDPYNSNTNYDNVVRTEDASTLINSPVTSGPFYAYRKVYPVYVPWSHHSKIFVELRETFPQKGRIWTQAYDPNNGWGDNGWTHPFTNKDVVPIANGGTGATSRGEVLYNFVVGGVYSGNLNDLATIGSYWINLSNCQNGPSSSGYGTMEVTRSTTNNYLQRFTFYMGMTYYRTFTNGRWYDWRALPNAHTAETLWEGSLKNGTATIANGAKYAYLIVGGWAGSNEDAVTQIIPVGWGTHMRLTSADKWLAYQCDSSEPNASIRILSNPYDGAITWVWGVNRYKE